jgi:Rhamnan synthesis protein F
VIPGWKLRRELMRLRQFMAWRWQAVQARARTREHDRLRPQIVQRFDGKRALQRRIAAVLVFQPGVLPQSLLESCDQLADLGYAVLVVSNGPLSPGARAALLPRVWRVLERPNLGYDFGGYREAVMHIWDQRLDPDELLILNDSVWMVRSALPGFLSCISALDADVAGSVLRSKGQRHWLESYFFQFRRSALESPVFRRFWRDYRLIDSKYGVIRQGERGISVDLAAGGLRIASLGGNAAFLDEMRKAPDHELHLALKYAAPIAGAAGQERAALIAEPPGPDWRLRVIAHMGSVLDGRRVWSSQFPVAAQRVMGYPFIKKSREPVQIEWRTQLGRAIRDKAIPAPSPAVLAEIDERQGQGVTVQPHWIARSTAAR